MGATDRASNRVPKIFGHTAAAQKLLSRGPRAIAVAVSGGPDSMALLYLLSHLVARQDQTHPTQIHAITFDHGLRGDSAAEARSVGEWVADWPHVTHHILKWTGKKPMTAIMEAARDARYKALSRWCATNGIDRLWLGHHAGDQAETFLFRLCKGSGLDGLSVMGECRPYADTGLMLVRPLLGLEKQEIEAYCVAQEIPFVRDSSNSDLTYARVRLRQSLPVLAAEGLTTPRLATTARRLAQAREALDFYTDGIIRRAAKLGPDSASVKITALRNAPAEMRVRVVRRLLEKLSQGKAGYGPRLDRLEDLLDVFFTPEMPFCPKNFTLGGYVFSHDRKNGLFVMTRQ